MAAVSSDPVPVTHHRNSLTFLRLVFASAVVLSHSFPLALGRTDPLEAWTNRQVSVGILAVACFFILSGYLVTGSVQRHSTGRYLLNRAARILPGYWAMLLVSSLVIAPAVRWWSSPQSFQYWSALTEGPASALGYLWHNALLRVSQDSITHVFENNPAFRVMNGSLWSLAPEAACYLLLALFALLGGFRRRSTTVVTAALFYALHVGISLKMEALVTLARTLTGWGFSPLYATIFRLPYLGFLGGMLLYQFRDRIPLRFFHFCLALLGLFGAVCYDAVHFAWPILLPYILLYLGERLPFQAMERHGDFSFGIYIYSFPIQQCLCLWEGLGFGSFLLLSLGASLSAGFLSWHLV